MAATGSQNFCNKNENYTEYHQYGYEVKDLIKTILKIARKAGLCVHLSMYACMFVCPDVTSQSPTGFTDFDK